MTIRCRTQTDVKLSSELKIFARCKGPSDPITGFEGMLKADKILKERDSRGLLIGSLVEDIWTGCSKRDLSNHKDVDVLVLDPDFIPQKLFEGGIDWWLPREKEIEYCVSGCDTCKSFENAKYYQNGNGVILWFNIERTKQALLVLRHPLQEPGLYIPSREFYANMRAEEARVRSDVVSGDPKDRKTAAELLKEEISRELDRRTLPEYVQKEFKGRILAGEPNSSGLSSSQYLEPRGIAPEAYAELQRR